MVNFLVTASTLVCFYAILCGGLNLQLGSTGLVNIGITGFFALGAYMTGMAMSPPSGIEQMVFHLGLPWILAAPIGVLATMVGAFLLGLALLRVIVDPIAVALLTLAFSQTLLLVLNTEPQVGNGQDGITGITRPLAHLTSFYGYEKYFLMALILIVAVEMTLLRRLTRSPFGRTLRLVRDEPALAEVLGFDCSRIRLTVFVLGSALAGVAGGLWAPYATAIQPSAFPLDVAFVALCVVVVGGSGNALGTLAGSVLVVGALQEGSRFLPKEIPTSFQGVFVGLLLILCVRLWPQGAIPERLISHAGGSANAVSAQD